MILPGDPLERVREGMQVVDTAGRHLGQVKRVELASPRVTHPPDSDIIDELASIVPAPPDMAEAGAELDVIGTSPIGHDPADLPDLPDELRAHLVEVGFLEVEGVNLPGVSRFIAADDIESVRDDQVVIHPR